MGDGEEAIVATEVEVLTSSSEAAPKRQQLGRAEDGRCPQCQRVIPGRRPNQRFCSDIDRPPLADGTLGRACRQAYGHAERERQRAEAAQQAALASLGMEGQQSLSGEVEELTTSVMHLHVRAAAEYTTEEAGAAFNSMYLQFNQEGWAKNETHTIPIFFRNKDQLSLLQPFVALARLPRDKSGHVLLNGAHVRSPSAVNKSMAGFQGYTSSQMKGGQNEVDEEQRRNIISLLPWSAWAAHIPPQVLPVEFEHHINSKAWADALESVLLAKFKGKFKELMIPWHPEYKIIYVHVLDQSSAAACFNWHIDIEEDTAHRRVHWTMVLLLHANGGVPNMRIAGAQVARFSSPGVGHIFDARLYHTTMPKRSDSVFVVKLGVFLGLTL